MAFYPDKKNTRKYVSQEHFTSASSNPTGIMDLCSRDMIGIT